MPTVEREQQQRFLRLFTAHEPAIRAFLRRLLPTRADADDVFQEASSVLWEKFDEFQPQADFRGWAFGIARFKALAWIRDRRRDRLVLSEEAVALLADETSREEPHLARQRAALELCAEKLTPAQRGLLFAAYQSGNRIHELATKSGRTVAGFYQWLHRMRRLLLDCMQRELKREIAF